MSIAERIKQARKAKHLTQEELGKMVGQTAGAITNYERGTREPNVLQIKKLAAALDVTGDWLIESEFAYHEQEERLMQMFRDMNDAGKQSLLMFAETMVNTPAYKKESSEQKGIV